MVNLFFWTNETMGVCVMFVMVWILLLLLVCTYYTIDRIIHEQKGIGVSLYPIM